MTECTTVSIPRELAARTDDTIERAAFSNTNDLVRFLLRSIVIQHERSGGDLSETESQEITEQLTDLDCLRWSTEASDHRTRAGSTRQRNAVSSVKFFLRWLGVEDSEF